MSDEQSGRERMSGDQSRDAFEAALSSLRPRVYAPESRPEFIPVSGASGANSQKCIRPAGHEFVCVFCGHAAPLNSRPRRWAWPTALVAMTSAAAVLLAMVIADRSSRVAIHESKLAPSSSANAAQHAESSQPSQETVATVRPPFTADRLAFRRQPGRVLSTADLELSDDFIMADNGSNSGPIGRQKADRQMNDVTTLRTLLNQYGLLETTTN